LEHDDHHHAAEFHNNGAPGSHRGTTSQRSHRENSDANSTTATWMRVLGHKLDPIVAQFIDFYHQPQNAKGINLGYAFMHFREEKIATRFIELMNDQGVIGRSKKKLQIMRAHMQEENPNLADRNHGIFRSIL